MKKKVYFLSDAHLGCRAFTPEEDLSRERKLVEFLNHAQKDAKAIYLVGDIFDFWYEYKTVVPRGHTRLLGKLAELSDQKIEIHFFIGNHDLWCNDYLQKECGIIVHRSPQTISILGANFFISHGDGLGDPDWKFRCLRSIFHSKMLQRFFSSIHPRWSLALGYQWAKQSRMKRETLTDNDYAGEGKDYLVLFSKKYLKENPTINYFIYGHRHLMLDLMMTRSSRMLILGDWISYFSYAVFDGEKMELHQYGNEQ
jgi:UDP-2,3-diacylglucosamine hydrolase